MTENIAAQIVRFTLRVAAVVVLVAAATRPAAAQTPTSPLQAPAQQAHWEFIVSNGRMIQTGAQRNAVQDGNMTAAQVWYAFNSTVAATGTAGWTRSRDLVEAGTPKRDIFSYDLGVEFRAARMPVRKALTIKPFAGLGFGGETHNDRGLDVAATNRVSEYGSAGVEVGLRRVALRVEARDYVTGFISFGAAPAAGTRNDVAILTGLRFGVR